MDRWADEWRDEWWRGERGVRENMIDILTFRWGEADRRATLAPSCCGNRFFCKWFSEFKLPFSSHIDSLFSPCVSIIWYGSWRVEKSRWKNLFFNMLYLHPPFSSVCVPLQPFTLIGNQPAGMKSFPHERATTELSSTLQIYNRFFIFRTFL